jgi:hypothetical protein
MTPKPYDFNLPNIKAFVLGCDPTAFNRNHKRLEFEIVFGLEIEDNPYVKGILNNLNLIGIALNGIYVQNLITEYQEFESSKNKEWMKTASVSIPSRKEEFDKIDPFKTITVFLTSELLYKVLLIEGQPKHKAIEFYESPELIPIPAEANKLGRPLIPLYRHPLYNLKSWPDYNLKVISLIKE